MDSSWILRVTLLCLGAICASSANDQPIQYCVIGAGPAGLQLGYFLQRSGKDYVIFEKNTTAGSFYLHYPRHRTLISINKRNTGSTNKEFSFRHDWNSLISDDETLFMKYYTKDYFPHADVYIKYLQDFASKLQLNIEYETEIIDVSRVVAGFLLTDNRNNVHRCRVLIVSTGMWVPNIPQFEGVEHTVGYESVSTNPEDFENKIVLILGRGNAGYETADSIVSHTAYIHMAGRSRIKLAYQTHYVGDLRAVNDQQIDTYQLKSLDGQFEGDISSVGVLLEKGANGKYYLVAPHIEDPDEQDNILFRHPYDIVIRCYGFKFDFSPFNVTTIRLRTAFDDKFPSIQPNYEATGIKNMFFAGVNTHSLDYKKSAGGFIHGYRYTVRALYHHLDWRYHGVPWPSVTLPFSDVLDHMIKRINEASGPYQMFGVLGDVALIRNDSSTVVYLEEVPLQSLNRFKETTGHDTEGFIIWNFEYGKGYSGPGNDVLSEDRVTGDPIEADKSNFLHPVIYYYRQPPDPKVEIEVGSLPEPDLYHHIVEDFLTDWTSRSRHIIPLRRFLEGVFGQDLRSFFAESCFEMLFTYGDNVPLSCKQHYLQGSGISAADDLLNFGSAEALNN